MQEILFFILSQPIVLAAWLGLSALCVALLIRDFHRKNPEIGGLMKLVWGPYRRLFGAHRAFDLLENGAQADRDGYDLAPGLAVHRALLFRLWAG